MSDTSSLERRQRTRVRGWPTAVDCRVARVAIRTVGLLVVAIVVLRWLIIPVIFPISSNAWCNCPLTVIQADIEATEATSLVKTGANVDVGDRLFVLENRLLDTSHTAALHSRHAELRAKRDRLASDYQDVRQHLNETSALAALYNEVTIQKHRSQLCRIEAAIESMDTQHTLALNRLTRHERLRAVNAASQDSFDSAREEAETAKVQKELLHASLDERTHDLLGAQKGVYLDRDAPILQSMAYELKVKTRSLHRQLTETEEQIRATDDELSEARNRDRRLSRSELTTHVDGVVWRMRSTGGTVSRGDPLIEIAVTKEFFVEALVDTVLSRHVKPGHRVLLAFPGRETLGGTVSRIAQFGPREVDASSAIKVPRELHDLRLVIRFDEAPTDASLLGRACRIMVVNRDATPLTEFSAWLFSNWRL